jgi:TetR/AcrR family transcriptional repressor of mexJK operon
MALDTKEKILSAALKLFSERGMAAVGTKAIAEAAGVNEVTLFRTFGSKDKLWVQVFHRYVVRPEPALFLAGATGDLEPDLHMVMGRIVLLLRENSRLIRMGMMDKERFPEITEELESQPGRVIALLCDYLGPLEAQLTAPAETVARTLVDTLFGVVIHFEVFQQTPGARGIEEWAEDFLPFFLRGALRSRKTTS